MWGLIVKIVSNQFTVKVDNQDYVCSARGKFKNNKESLVVGDIVKIDIDTKTIEERSKRKNALDRPLIANVDVALIVTSIKKPVLSYTLLNKLISIITINNIEPVICLTKMDLCSDVKKEYVKEHIKKYYESIGIKVFFNTELTKIKKYLAGKIVVLTGQTGAGKSTLLNKLNPNLNLETKPISEALNRGVHTTRHTEIFEIDKILFVDTPGFSAIDFKDVSLDSLKESFVEFKKYPCKYKDCNHDKESDCNIKTNVLNGNIMQQRYDSYLQFRGEIIESSRKLYK